MIPCTFIFLSISDLPEQLSTVGPAARGGEHLLGLEVANGTTCKVEGTEETASCRAFEEVLGVDYRLLVRLPGQILQVLHEGEGLRVTVVKNTLGGTIGHRLEVPVSSVGWIVRLGILVAVARPECFVLVARRSLVGNVILIHHLIFN